jgi:hypothetical protein
VKIFDGQFVTSSYLLAKGLALGQRTIGSPRNEAIRFRRSSSSTAKDLDLSNIQAFCGTKSP